MTFTYAHIIFQVVHNVGLCIALFDIIEIGDSYILPGDGSSHTPGIYAINIAAVNQDTCVRSFLIIFLACCVKNQFFT